MAIPPESTPLLNPDPQTLMDDLRLLTPEQAECLRQIGKSLAARVIERLITKCDPGLGLS
jgi:hypothetical protein